jgi:hypothetical protein
MSTAAFWFDRSQSIGPHSRKCLSAARQRHATLGRSGRGELIGQLEMRTLLAHSPIALPYTTTFASTPDTNGDVYQNGALQGQALGTMSPATGWVNENGETNDTATVDVGQGVTLASQDTPGIWSDVYNSNLADHSSAPGNGNGTPLNPASYGNKIDISYTLNIAAGGSLNPDGAPAAAFGSRILDQNDDLLAALFTGPPATGGATGEEDVYVQTGTSNGFNTDLVGPAAGTAATYSIDLNFVNKDFTVYVNGVTDSAATDIPFGTGETGTLQIGGVALSTDNNGVDSATFGSLDVVPAVVALHLASDGTSSVLATGKISPITGDSPLTATATVSNQLGLWLGTSTTDTGSATASATGSTSSTFAADGLIAPAGKDSYSTTFSSVGDRVAVNLSLSAAAGVLNLLGLVVPTSALKPSSTLVDELDKIYKGTDLGAAEADLRAGAAGTISTASAAHAIAEHISDLSADGGAQWAVVKHDLKDAGVTLTAAQVNTLESVTTIDHLSKTLLTTAKLDTQLQSGEPVEVNFIAKAG